MSLHAFFGTCEGSDITIADFYSCDRFGDPQDCFPLKTTVYFNISIRNSGHNPQIVFIYISVLDELAVPIGLAELNVTIPHDVSLNCALSVFIPKWAHVGFATAHASVFVGENVVGSDSTDFYIGPEDLTPPVISVLSPENITYGTEIVPLVFSVDERTFWTGYSLNNLENVSIVGNATLAGLANGPYSLMVYANDTSGNMCSSEEICFTMLVVHDVAVNSLESSCSEAYIGQIVTIAASVQNEGTVAETFNITAYASMVPIETLSTIDLFSNNETTLVFVWNTTAFKRGNYTISAQISPVLGETDTVDNTYVGGVIEIMSRPDILVTDVTSSKSSLGQGYSLTINVTVRNRGDLTEFFDVTLYANATIVQTKTLSLANATNNTIAFAWNTMVFVKGNYTIKANITSLPGEMNTADNTLEGGWILITIPGDTNGDCRVDILDAIRLSASFMSQQFDPEWHPDIDINDDNTVNILDAIILAAHFSEEWT